MAEKDIVSKDLLKRIAVDIAQVLLHLKVDHAEILETEYQRNEDRRADLVAHMHGEDGSFILHIEIQNDNEPKMPARMLRYRSDILHTHTELDIRQYLIYIGKAPLRMADGIRQTGLDYHYRIIDMHTVDCQTLLTQDNLDALVLAVLCDFKGRPDQEVVRYITQRIYQLTAENESRRREYMRMLEILSTNRGLEQIIEEEEKMLSQVDQTRLPSYRIGMQQGMQQEAVKMLERQLQRRFGFLSETILTKLKKAELDQLERWADNILDAKTLDDVFRD